MINISQSPKMYFTGIAFKLAKEAANSPSSYCELHLFVQLLDCFFAVNSAFHRCWVRGLFLKTLWYRTYKLYGLTKRERLVGLVCLLLSTAGVLWSDVLCFSSVTDKWVSYTPML